MGSDRVLALFRFGEHRYIEQLVREGHLYMNPLSHFASYETGTPRSDEYEGTLVSMQPQRVKLLVESESDRVFREIPEICGPISYRGDAVCRVNVYCMYALRASRASDLIDPRNFALGDTYAVFTDGDEFFRRLRRAAGIQGLKLTWRLVEYIDRDTYHGKVGVFRKLSTFSYQSELRIAIFPGTGGPFSLRLGDLSAITLTGELASVNRRLRLSDPDA